MEVTQGRVLRFAFLVAFGCVAACWSCVLPCLSSLPHPAGTHKQNANPYQTMLVYICLVDRPILQMAVLAFCSLQHLAMWLQGNVDNRKTM